MLPDFQDALRLRGSRLDEDVSDLVMRMKAACQKLLMEFEDDIRRDSSSSARGMPEDGTVHELTSTTVNYLKRVAEYRQTAEALLPRIQGSRNPPVQEYVNGILVQLKGNLERKAEKDKKALLLSNIFLMNNYHYIQTTLGSSDLDPALSASSVVGDFKKVLEDQIETYNNNWMKAADSMSLLIGDDGKKSMAGHTYTSREKSAVKDKLKTFNTELEDHLATLKSLTVPDPTLQKRLRDMIKNKLVLQYCRFVERYGDAPFAKNKAKYVRYTKDTMLALVDKFFEGQQATSDPKKLKFKF
eukprot:TRINITY_DN7258_c0_g1_i5.p1 TRINITY_DN7258_c0_g1~~TRINITY_DN7258_c0_g1_i5.p1  ORF type:complete len:321 (-),score=103.65 TRINITY_DN7258_c0_g1_i5:20-919(-)